MAKEPNPFPTEAALCAAFIASVDARKWVAYAETAKWDILMVRKADGFQIGIQAKQRMNTDVINQALEHYHYWSHKHAGPDCRALLVPSSGGFELIAKYLALVIIKPSRSFSFRNDLQWRFNPVLPNATTSPFSESWPEWAPAKRHELPEYVPDVAAGSSAPVQLTDWKIKALKLAVLLKMNGAVCRADFVHLALDPRRWVEGGWLARENGNFVKGPGWPGFDKQHPRVYKEIMADFKKWAPKETNLKQGALI